MLATSEGLAMNTLHDKPNEKLITYHAPSSELGPPYERGKYETLDYCVTTERWKNTVQDVESDMKANITSDHYPLWWKTRLKLSRKTNKEYI